MSTEEGKTDGDLKNIEVENNLASTTENRFLSTTEILSPIEDKLLNTTGMTKIISPKTKKDVILPKIETRLFSNVHQSLNTTEPMLASSNGAINLKINNDVNPESVDDGFYPFTGKEIEEVFDPDFHLGSI